MLKINLQAQWSESPDNAEGITEISGGGKVHRLEIISAIAFILKSSNATPNQCRVMVETAMWEMQNATFHNMDAISTN
jgi:hypothetical protein